MFTFCVGLALALAPPQVPASQEARDRAVTVHVIDQEGALLAAGWRAFATYYDPASATPNIPARVEVPVDADTGVARITGLPIAVVSVGAVGPDRQRADARKVDLVAVAHAEIELVAALVDDSHAIRADLNTGPYLPDASPGSVFAIARDGTRHPMERQRDVVRSRWRVDGLTPGEYVVRVEDPRFEAVESLPTRTGAIASVAVTGAASLRLDVLDVTTGADVSDYTLVARYPLSLSTAFLRRAGHARGGGPLYAGLLADEVELDVTAPGHPRVIVRPGRLRGGETRHVQVEVGRVVECSGRVLDATRAGLVGVKVFATRGSFPGHDDEKSGAVSGPQGITIQRRDAETITGATGSFVFDALVPDRYTFTIERGPFTFDHFTRDVLADVAEPFELILPPLGEVEVDVLLPVGVDAAQFALTVRPASSDELLLSAMRRPRALPLEGLATSLRLALHPGPRVLYLVELAAGGIEALPLRAIGEVAVEVRLDALTSATLDARATAPVSVTLRTDVLGEDAAWLTGLGLIRVDEGVPASRNGATLVAPKPGEPIVGKLTRGPGNFRAYAVGPGWFYDSPKSIALGSDQPRDIALNLALAARTYELQDVEGRPLIATPVVCRFDGGGLVPGPAITVTTDAQGRLRALGPVAMLHLGLPAGQNASVSHGTGATVVVRARERR